MNALGMGSPETKRARPVREAPLLLAFVALLTLVLLGPIMTYSTTSDDGSGNPIRQAAYLVILVVVVWAIRPLNDPRRLLVVPWPLLVALGWCWLSLVWAVDPGIGVRRLALTTMVLWTILALVRHLGYEKTVLLFRVAMVVALIANFVAVFGFPDLGIHQLDEPGDKMLIGDWRGIMMHKNFGGAVSALTILAFLFDTRRIPMALRVVVVAAAAFFLFKSSSKTSVGIGLGAIVLGILYMRYNARYRMLLLPLVCVLALAGCVFLNVYTDPLLRNLHNPDALTGRTQIWLSLLNYSADHRLLGAGFGSFWNIGPDSPVFEYGKGWVGTVVTGHNGYLDLLVAIGLPGLLIVIATFVIWPLVRLFSSPATIGPRGALALVIFFFCVGHNMTETSLLDRDSILQVCLLFAIGLIYKLTEGSAGQQRQRQAVRPSRKAPIPIRRVA